MPAPTRMVHGADVSHHTNEKGAIDWHKAAGAGLAFAIVKVTEGATVQDEYGSKNIEAALAAGLKVSPYHFYRPDEHDPVGHAQEQVRYFVEHVTTIHGGFKGLLHPCLDVELDSKERPGNTRGNYSKGVRAFIDLLHEKIGARPFFYTYHDMWQHLLTDTFGDCPLWIADYSSKLSSGAPNLFGQWHGKPWVLWQYSDKGSWPGIHGAGSLDVDVFNGDVVNLEKYVIG